MAARKQVKRGDTVWVHEGFATGHAIPKTGCKVKCSVIRGPHGHKREAIDLTLADTIHVRVLKGQRFRGGGLIPGKLYEAWWPTRKWESAVSAEVRKEDH